MHFVGSNLDQSPPLIPYPNFENNRLPYPGEPANNRIISAFRMSIDQCDRLWLVDMRDSNGTSYGDPELFVIDLITDQVVRQFTITKAVKNKDGGSFFPGLIVDVDPTSCDQAYAYVADIHWGMVVYSFWENTAWRIEHHYFYFDPLSTSLNIGGVPLLWTDGLFGMTLSERHLDGFRTLYFHALASTRIFSVDTRILQSNGSLVDTFDHYRFLGCRRAGTQASSMSMDHATGAIFFALIHQDAIGCWNPRRSRWLSSQTSTVVAQDSETLLYPADLKVINSNLWVISDKLPVFRFRVSAIDVNQVNYRVFRASAAEVVRGTVCEPDTHYDHPQNGGHAEHNHWHHH